MTFLAHLSPAGTRLESAAAMRSSWSGQGGSSFRLSVQIFSPLAEAAELHPAPGLPGLHFAGRVRLDRRAELVTALGLSRHGSAAASDAMLCLHAWARWHGQAIDRLHGDFAFVVWDAARRELFCARDRIGVRSLAWLRDGADWWIGDALNELLAAAPARARAFDDRWIADFLESGVSSDPSATVYAQVRRLPPAHVLRAAGRAEPEIRRYWQLGPAEPVLLRSTGAYREQFNDLLATAVADRLPASGRVGIMLSGGLDSTSLAATAVDLVGGDRVVARTGIVGGERDPEAAASRTVAERLGISQAFVEMALLAYDPAWPQRGERTAEPDLAITRPPAFTASVAQMGSQATVWFYGEGPDNALTFEWRAWLRWLARRRRWTTLAGACASWVATKTPREWVTTVAVWTGREPLWSPPPPMPWLRPLADVPRTLESTADFWRPQALANLRGPLWPDMLEELDRQHAVGSVDWRHPFLDLRLLEFMLRTPPVPWGRRKRLIREAMAGRLPEETLRRGKTAFYQDPGTEFQSHPLPPLRLSGAIEDYVSVADLPAAPAHPEHFRCLVRVAILDHWLRHRRA